MNCLHLFVFLLVLLGIRPDGLEGAELVSEISILGVSRLRQACLVACSCLQVFAKSSMDLVCARNGENKWPRQVRPELCLD